MIKPIRVVIVDDHQVFVDALATRLSDEPDITVVGKAMTTAAALGIVSGTDCDVVIVDLFLQGEDGLALAHEILDRLPDVSIVVVTGADDDSRVLDAVRIGVRGWVSKVAPVTTLLSALRGVAAGETHIPADMLTGVLVQLNSQGHANASYGEAIRLLTNRELEVLSCLVEGRSRNEIGEILHVSPNTVRTHIQSILHKLNVHSALAAVAIARRSGMSGISDRVINPNDVGGFSREVGPPGLLSFYVR